MLIITFKDILVLFLQLEIHFLLALEWLLLVPDLFIGHPHISGVINLSHFEFDCDRRATRIHHIRAVNEISCFHQLLKVLITNLLKKLDLERVGPKNTLHLMVVKSYWNFKFNELIKSFEKLH